MRIPNRRTETVYKAELERISLHHKTKSNTARVPYSKCSGYMGLGKVMRDYCMVWVF